MSLFGNLYPVRRLDCKIDKLIKFRVIAETKDLAKPSIFKLFAHSLCFLKDTYIIYEKPLFVNDLIQKKTTPVLGAGIENVF